LIPELYYVLFGFHLVLIGPHTNPLGEVWYWYNYNGESGHLKPDQGALDCSFNGAFMMGPLYIVTTIGLILRRAWVVPVGLVTGGAISYAIIYFVAGDFHTGLPSVTNVAPYSLTSLPYLVYPFWLVPVLWVRRFLFASAR
jgi:hypothetical protein